MFSRILVCLDGSDLAEQALPYASAQAQKFRSQVVLMQVVPLMESTLSPSTPLAPPQPGYSGPAKERIGSGMKLAEKYLSGIAESMKAEGMDTTFQVIADPGSAEAIVDYAHRNQIDLIAMTTHGYSGLGRAVFGSVADYIMRESGLPVLVKKAV